MAQTNYHDLRHSVSCYRWSHLRPANLCFLYDFKIKPSSLFFKFVHPDSFKTSPDFVHPALPLYSFPSFPALSFLFFLYLPLPFDFCACDSFTDTYVLLSAVLWYIKNHTWIPKQILPRKHWHPYDEFWLVTSPMSLYAQCLHTHCIHPQMIKGNASWNTALA